MDNKQIIINALRQIDAKYEYPTPEQYAEELLERGVVQTSSVDQFWFCSFGGCEGACKECKDTCEMSIFVKERRETVNKILNKLNEKIKTYHDAYAKNQYFSGMLIALCEIKNDILSLFPDVEVEEDVCNV